MTEAGGSPNKWADLRPRVLSAIVLSVVGIGAVWLGGAAMTYAAALAGGLIVWEITRMCSNNNSAVAMFAGVIAGAAIVFSGYASGWIVGVLLLGVPVVIAGALAPGGDRWRQVIYGLWVMVAVWGLVDLRLVGVAPVLWLVAVVVATDVAGYFAGRIIGGPKFWPRVSPKKTWSGTAAGWIAALLVGLAFAPLLGAGVIWLSVLVSFASQMGDAAESALKRAKGVKDASAIIPGHGGVFDRFDAMLGAALVVTLARLAGLIGG